jgi:hypothetical protein
MDSIAAALRSAKLSTLEVRFARAIFSYPPNYEVGNRWYGYQHPKYAQRVNKPYPYK